MNSKISKSLMENSGITEEFLKKSFGDFITEGLDPIIQTMKQTAAKYFVEFDTIENERSNSIALLGQPGSGKTHLLMALCNNMMNKKRKSVQYFPYVEGFDEIRADLKTLNDKLEIMKNKDILFIDDLFKPATKMSKSGNRIKVPQASDWEIKQIYSVINYRYLNYKPVFISTELSFEELFELDEALGSRIFEMCKKYYEVIPKDMNLNYRLK